MLTDRGSLERMLVARDLQPLGDSLRCGELDRLLPGLRVALDRPQRSHYHDLSVLDHSLRVAEAMPPLVELRWSGLLHDVGKASVVSINPKTGDEQFLGHAQAGAHIAQRLLDRLGYDPALVRRVAWRVEHHMDLHHAAHDAYSPRALRKVRDRLSGELDAMFALALADIAAMAPTIRDDKRAETLALRDRMQRVVE